MLEQPKEHHPSILLALPQLVEEAVEPAEVQDLILTTVPAVVTVYQNTHLVTQVLVYGLVNRIALAEVLEAITVTSVTTMMSNTKFATMEVMAELMEVAVEKALEEVMLLALAVVKDLVVFMAAVTAGLMVMLLAPEAVLQRHIMVLAGVARAAAIV